MVFTTQDTEEATYLAGLKAWSLTVLAAFPAVLTLALVDVNGATRIILCVPSAVVALRVVPQRGVGTLAIAVVRRAEIAPAVFDTAGLQPLVLAPLAAPAGLSKPILCAEFSFNAPPQ